jgi:hypothetical protein
MSEQENEGQVTIHVDDPESLSRGLGLLNDNITAIGQAVGTLGMLLGITIAMKEGANNPQLTLTESLFVALDTAEQHGQFSAAMIQNLRTSLQRAAKRRLRQNRDAAQDRAG